jgi:hypothetical protein
MKNHQLKTDPNVFQDSILGVKNFEIRKNDREFKVNDHLTLLETTFSGEEMLNGKVLTYTGRNLSVKINYILYGPCYGIEAGWVVMSVEKLKRQDND